MKTDAGTSTCRGLGRFRLYVVDSAEPKVFYSRRDRKLSLFDGKTNEADQNLQDTLLKLEGWSKRYERRNWNPYLPFSRFRGDVHCRDLQLLKFDLLLREEAVPGR